MKKLLLIVILTLTFQPLTKGDEISDFQIEGMSIGDSLLDHMNENLIIKAKNNEFAFKYKNDFVSVSTWDIRDNFTIYDDVGVILDLNDKSYKIFGLEGSLYLDDEDIKKCHKKQNEISTDIKTTLNSNFEENTYFIKKSRLPKHISSVKYIDFEFNDGSAIRVSCYEIIKGIEKNSNFHQLYVVVNSSTFWKYLDNR